MQKYTFTVEIVSESPVGLDSDYVTSALTNAVDGIGKYRAVNCDDVSEFGEHGLKVWAKRRGGFSLATPKVKKPKVVKAKEVAVETETQEAVVAS